MSIFYEYELRRWEGLMLHQDEYTPEAWEEILQYLVEYKPKDAVVNDHNTGRPD